MTSDSSTGQIESMGSPWLSWILGLAVLAGVVIAARHFSEEEAFVRLAREAKPLWVLAALTLQAATLWMLIRSLGATARISHVFASFMIANLVRTVSFIPGGLGTFEAAAVLMLKIDGVSVAVGLSTALLFRGLTFFLPMAPGLWFSRRVNRHPTP